MEGPRNLYIALVHYPVYNKNGDIVTTSITTLDLHDISRISKTFGVKTFFLITPLFSQESLMKKMLSHWSEGYGSTYNPTRKEALSVAKVVVDISEACESIKKEHGCYPTVIATGAKENDRNTSFAKLRENLKGDKPHLVLFGTGWGLAEEVLETAEYLLEPIRGGAGEFNHLPVRAAVAIIIDRLLRV